jgi:hypothetical protein
MQWVSCTGQAAYLQQSSTCNLITSSAGRRDRQVAQTAGRLRAAGSSSGSLHFLDFADDMLTPDDSALVPGLHLDGTHLAPTYLSHLQHAVSVEIDTA